MAVQSGRECKIVMQFVNLLAVREEYRYNRSVFMKTSLLMLMVTALGGLSLPLNAETQDSAESAPQVIVSEPGQSATFADEDGMTITVNIDELAGENADGSGEVHIDADALAADCPEVKQFLDAMLALKQTLDGVSDAESAAAAVETVQGQLTHLRAVGMLADSALQAQPEEKRNQLSFVLMMTAFPLSESVNRLADTDFYGCEALQVLFLPPTAPEDGAGE